MTALNDPPMLEAPEGTVPLDSLSQDSIREKLIATESSVPEIEDGGEAVVELPAGWISPNGSVVKTALVRELNGYDEERLSRVNPVQNPAKFVTELLVLATDDLGGVKPTRTMLTELLLGDRDALVLGIRKATYGPKIDFKLSCDKCDNESDIVIDITDPEDIPVVLMEEPTQRTFEVKLRRGIAKVTLLTGGAQEVFSENIGKKTQAEVNSLMLAKSVIEIDGIATFGSEDSVRALSMSDRETIQEFLADHQPGPQFKSIWVPCATCGEKYSIGLGLSDMFRF